MAVTSSQRTLIPHIESKRKAPQLLVPESWADAVNSLNPAYPKSSVYFHTDPANSIPACVISLCTHTCLLVISKTGFALKRPEDEIPTLQKSGFVNSQGSLWHLEGICYTIIFFWYDACSDKMHGINWWTKKNLFLRSGIPPHTVALMFGPGKTVSGFASVKALARNKNIMLQGRNIKAQFKFLYW